MRVKPDGPVYEVKFISVRADSLSVVSKPNSAATLSNLKSVSCDVGSCTLNSAVSRDIDEFVSNFKDVECCLPSNSSTTNSLNIGNVNFQKTAAFDTIHGAKDSRLANRELTTLANKIGVTVDKQASTNILLPSNVTESDRCKLVDNNRSHCVDVQTNTVKGGQDKQRTIVNGEGHNPAAFLHSYKETSKRSYLTSNKNGERAVDENRFEYVYQFLVSCLKCIDNQGSIQF